MILAVSLISGGAALLIIGSCVMSHASEFCRCQSCGSLHNALGYIIKYNGYAAKFRSQQLHDDPFPVRPCRSCKSKLNP